MLQKALGRRSLIRSMITMILALPIFGHAGKKVSAMSDENQTGGHDLAAMFDQHVKHEFIDKDVDATMRTMTEDPYVHNVATGLGGVEKEGVRQFYAKYFVGKMPADTKVTPISRMVGKDSVVDEVIVSFTHDIPIDLMLPGIPPTGKKVELVHVVVVKFENGKVAHEHIYWDQGSLLAQVGILDPAKVPVLGLEQTKRLLEVSSRKKQTAG